MSDKTVNNIVRAFQQADYNKREKSLVHALHDHNLPIFVRAFILYAYTLNATEKLIFRGAGYNFPYTGNIKGAIAR